MQDFRPESLSPREFTMAMPLGGRSLNVTLREMTIRGIHHWEDACLDVDRKTLDGIEQGLAASAITLLRNNERAKVLRQMLQYETSDDRPTDDELQDVRFSVVEKLFRLQADLNRGSDVVGEVQNLLDRVARQIPTSSDPESLALEASASSDGSGSSSSATTSQATTT